MKLTKRSDLCLLTARGSSDVLELRNRKSFGKGAKWTGVRRRARLWVADMDWGIAHQWSAPELLKELFTAETPASLG
jgi:hypothetical protein